MSYIGVIIEESLADKEIINDLKIINTRVEKVTAKHQTPHLNQWTLHYIKIPEDQAEEIARRLSKVLDINNGHWYADFKSANHHYIIFKEKVFFVDRFSQTEYDQVKKYGISLGIPDYQVDFKAKKK